MRGESGSDAERPRGASRRATARQAIVAAVIAAAWVAAFVIRFDGGIPVDRVHQLWATLPLVVLLQLFALRASEVDRDSWRYTSLHDMVPLVGAVSLVGGVLVLLRLVASPLVVVWPGLDYLLVPHGVTLSYVAAASIGLVAVRVARRLQTERREAPTSAEEQRRVFLVGAGRAGSLVASELAARPDLGIQPVGFIDDDPGKQRQRIVGVPVRGTSNDLEALVEEFEVDDLIITIASLPGPQMRQLIERCEEVGFHPQIVPGMYEIVGGHVSLNWFRPVEIEDLLGRDPVDLDLQAIRDLLTGEVVMVTGAGGSIGAELARQIASFAPARLVLVERAEPALWAIHRELSLAYPDLDLVPALADVTDVDRVDELLATHHPSAILHAAAHKHVPLVEDNPGEAVKNNVMGTRTVVDLAAKRGVERFVLISTDKAVNPTSVMGATKRLAERYVQHVAHQTGRDYVSVRFGNVLGSTGSVVPVFEQQITEGGPVTVTDPEMRRYFMTIPEASQLVLEAATVGRSGEVLVLDMGEPVKIVELAESMIRLSGFEPYDDIDIVFTGLRPGEKLFEELSLAEEGAERTRHPKVWIGNTPQPNWGSAASDLEDLRAVSDRATPEDLRARLDVLVPEYRATRAPVGEPAQPRA
jgi:FlaA1/EpsC-like NDP-sugar epimerase